MKFNRLSDYKIKKIINCFSMDLTDTATSELLKLNRKTVNNYFTEFRELILADSIQKHQKELGTFELDESYFGAKRVRGKRGRGAAARRLFLGS